MFINNKQYNVDLTNINKLKYVISVAICNSPEMIDQLMSIIKKYIEYLDISFDLSAFAIIVKIKKTAMRKMYKFKHEPSYYYDFTRKIFLEFIQQNEQLILNRLATLDSNNDYVKAKEYLNYVYGSPSILANICHVTCIGDNVLIINF